MKISDSKVSYKKMITPAKNVRYHRGAYENFTPPWATFWIYRVLVIQHGF
jgi:hypothetical protein